MNAPTIAVALRNHGVDRTTSEVFERWSVPWHALQRRIAERAAGEATAAAATAAAAVSLKAIPVRSWLARAVHTRAQPKAGHWVKPTQSFR